MNKNKSMVKLFRFGVIVLLAVFSAMQLAADELLYEETLGSGDVASFNVNTRHGGSNDPIEWQHYIPADIQLAYVTKAALEIEAYDVKWPTQDVDPEQCRLYFNNVDLGLLKGVQAELLWTTFVVPVNILIPGNNELKVYVDEMDSGDDIYIWRSKLRLYSNSVIPTVVTGAISDITWTSASCGGNVTSEGAYQVTVRGVCWGTDPYPDLVDNDGYTEDGFGTGEFNAALSGLTSGNFYYVRAYATNSNNDTAYGDNVYFTTLSDEPVVLTGVVSDITYTSASCIGNVTSEGSSTVTARGVCWDTEIDPDTNDSKTMNGGGTGEFSGSITGLSSNMTYYVRAYATNSSGTAYGGNVSFSTNAAGLPTVITSTVSRITGTTATGGGNVTSQGDSAVTARGICWDTDPYPTTADDSTDDGGGTGEFTSAMTGLNSGTVYYVRAYAINSSGTAYGDNVSFSTNAAGLPTVITSSVTGITGTTVTGGGNVTSQGDSAVTARGICWDTDPYPTTADDSTDDGGGTGEFSSAMTGLNSGTVYYVRAYAINGNGTAYGDNVSFSTNTPGLPTVITSTVTGITGTTATGGGNVTSQGDSSVTARGICWGTDPYPTTADDSTDDGGGTGEFSSEMTGLNSGTVYYVRAYAINSSGTAYGDNVSFSTNSPGLPTVITSSVTGITGTTVTGGGNVTSAGDSTVTSRGICWGTAPYPDISGNITTDGSGTGEFSSAMTGLTQGTFYYVRAYATNSSGTAYGSNVTFTTLSDLPTVITGAVSNVTYTSASCGGNVTSEGASLVTERGVCWGTSQNPTITSDSYTMNGGGTGNFTDSVTGLSPNTAYYVRAYATNSSGTSYGGNVSFSTNPAALPTVTTTTVTNITQTTATGGGNVTSAGDSAVTARGLCWGIAPYPSIAATNYTIDGSGTGEFTSEIAGLIPGAVYYVRAYATNSSGTTYGDNVSFITSQAALPVVTTATVTGITGTSATGGGNVTSGGDSTVTARGICWGVLAYPTITANNFTIDAGGTGEFTSEMTGLTPGAFYYVRAYATNISGTSYGSNVTFTTVSNLPTVVIGTVYNITYTSASCSANVTSQGTSTVTARGVCWSTSPYPTIPADSYTVDGGGTGDFYASITGLSPDTTYYVRPYATNIGGTAYGSNLSFTTNPEALPTVTTASVTDITDTTATGGGNIVDEGDSAVTARGVCWDTSPYPTISTTNFTSDGDGTGEFSSVISDLSPETLYYARAYATNSSGTVYGDNVSFTTEASPTVELPTVSTRTISNITTTTASSGGNVTDDGGADVTARGVCWSTSSSPTTADYYTDDGSGTGSFTSSITGLTEGVTYYVKAYATNEAGTGYGSQKVFTAGRSNSQGPPQLSVSRTKMNFTVMLSGTTLDTMTGSQRFFIVNTGGGTLEWTAAISDTWIDVSPASGTGDALVSVSINPSGLTLGENTGSITISDPDAEDSPQTVTVNLRVADNSEDTYPKGSFETPIDGSYVNGSIPVTGWAIDDVDVTSVKIYRDPVSGEGSGRKYIGEVVFVEGARPDVEILYDGYPKNSSAGWGYMLLTHFLPDTGNGTYTLYAEATDSAGHKTELGNKTIICDNDNAVKPFGAIDTPAQGGIASGDDFTNWGWALTPQPKYIPTDGSTITVLVDGKNLGSPTYNVYRADIARLFPGYINSNGAVGYFSLDTTAFTTGVHTIAWQVKDVAGNADGIGSRYFIIINSGSTASAASKTNYSHSPPAPAGTYSHSPLLTFSKGWRSDRGRQRFDITPDKNGILHLETRELEPVEICSSTDTTYTSAAMLVGGKHRPLPPGAGLDKQTNTFRWMPGPGFVGSYAFVLTGIRADGQKTMDHVCITIQPK